MDGRIGSVTSVAAVGGELLFGMFEYVVTHAPMKGWGNHVAS